MESPPSGIGKIYIKAGLVSNFGCCGRLRAVRHNPTEDSGNAHFTSARPRSSAVG
jgi:hypothetical protein